MAGRERIRHGVRISLDQIRGNERATAADLAVRLRDQGADEALLIAFGPRGATGTRARPDHCRKLVAALKAQLAAGSREERVAVVDAIFTANGRWWSYMCRNSRCCPAVGTTVPAEPPAALAALLAGQGEIFASREAMDDTFAPYGITAARRMKAALRQAIEDAVPNLKAPAPAAGRKAAVKPLPPGRPSPGVASAVKASGQRSTKDRVSAGAASTASTWTEEAIAGAHGLADELLARCVDGKVEFSDAEGAELLVAMAEWRVRDYLACIAFEEPRAERLLCLMAELSRRAPGPDWRTAPLSLAAWAAWALGRTSLAQCAVDRALATDNGYHFALLIRAGLHHGISSESVRASAENTRRELFGEGGAMPGGGQAADADAQAAPPLPAQRVQPDSEEARS
jgi:hypothetical protein